MARKFSLRDAMILVAATAIGLWVFRLIDITRLLEDFGGLNSHGEFTRNAPWKRVAFRVYITWPMLSAWSLALFVIHLLPPNPRPRHTFRQPGMAACAAAAMLIGVCAPFLLYSRLTHGEGWLSFDFPWYIFFFGPSLIGWGVATVWANLFLSRSWRPRPNWLDRLGRILGWLWFLMAILSLEFVAS